MSADIHAAIEYATQCHDGQFRDGEHALPYITHPHHVLRLLRDVAAVTDQRLWCAAILHDVLEDTEATIDELKELFGEDIASIVAGLTRDEPEPSLIAGMDKDEIWQVRSDMLIEEIKGMTPEMRTIKLCDRLSNLEEAKLTRKGKKLTRYIDQTKRILKVIPRSTCPALWDRVQALTK